MIGKEIKIQQRQLLRVEKGFWSSGVKEVKGMKTKMFHKKGSILEIRYQFAWYFRNELDVYDHASEECLRKNCSFFGWVKHDIAFQNKKKTKEIIDEVLYHKPEDFEIKLKSGEYL